MAAETEEKRCADEPMSGAMESVDVDMEDDGALAGAGLSLTDELSQLVFNELAAYLPQVKSGGMKRLVIDEAAAEGEKNIDLQLVMLGIRIGIVYKLESMEAIKLTSLAVNHAASRAREFLAPPTTELDSKERKQLQAAFEQPYVGNTHLKFHGYLARCWHAYKAKRNGYTSPYVPLVQSSGFGKSRLLRELAGVTKNATTMPRTQLTDSDSEISMRVLYVCARSVPKSSGFPIATPSLTRWFFSENHTVEVMKERLLTTFKYAQQYWETVGDKWFELFSDPSADESVRAAIAAPQTDGLSEDVRPLNRLLVLVVDEARTLFDLKDAHGVDFFRLFRRALTAANDELETSRYGGGIFAVLVDTNSKVHDFAPPQENDPSSRKTKHRGATALFPPFVLTHTMDVFCRTPQSLTPDPDTGSASVGSHAGTPPDVPNSESPPAAPFDYKASVTRGDPEAKWAALISMGRPLWKSFVGKDASLDMQKGLISKLAASKLLQGQPPDLESSYNESTMFGVAALLCRLGLRPHSSSALSSRIVADFMGVLNYVTFTNDSQITSYPSEPALAFGAASLWYQLQSATLEKYLLPRFQEMLMQRLVDIGDIGEVVARIFLLLAMDATVV
ncbi:hypothetical protein BBJ28_00025779 [Nothophytophthora sp. Chile5]|nr:hypothetical protein BBJ28_00025779 [Nothophytophthora sp. Chile5]